MPRSASAPLHAWYRNVVDLLLLTRHSMSLEALYKGTASVRSAENYAVLVQCDAIVFVQSAGAEHVRYEAPKVSCAAQLRDVVARAFPRAVPRHVLYGAYMHVENDIDAELYARRMTQFVAGRLLYLRLATHFDGPNLREALRSHVTGHLQPADAAAAVVKLGCSPFFVEEA